MKIIGTTFEKLPRERLVIGFEGENLRATVRIDCASVFAEYPNATPTLIVKPLFADAYPVVVDRNGTDVDWLITSEILSFTGDGEIQLVFYKGEVICKSAVSKIRVCRSLTVTGEMPDPVVQWIENANRKLAEVDAQIVELEGMVDTATDAAERAEQSASTASTKAEQAAGSAATASTKAAEAQASANTATAKASEAALSATQARNSAVSAADSERIATAKAGEATTAAGTATTKATEATEAARTATEKAGDASASATAAHASEINAAESADDALSAEVGANAAKRAAETSATQAGTSAQNAGIAAQTATQKAAEATQSATNAATSATSAATSATTASTKAGEAAQSAQVVEETAEQLADSLEQIAQNTADIAEHEQEYNALKEATLIHNTASGSIASFVDGAEMPVDEVTAQINPVQDLHGYDHPWPGGGGINKFPISLITQTKNGTTFTVSDDGVVTISGTPTAQTRIPLNGLAITPDANMVFGVTGSATGVRVFVRANDSGTVRYPTISPSGTLAAGVTYDQFYLEVNTTFTGTASSLKFQLEVSSTAPTSWSPYANICPISGHDSVSVWDDPVYGGTIKWNQLLSENQAVGSYSKFGLTFAMVSGKMGFNVTGTFNFESGDRNAYIYRQNYPIAIIKDHVYCIAYDSKYATVYCYGAQFSGNWTGYAPHGGSIIKATNSANLNLSLNFGPNISNGTVFNEEILINLFDLTEMFGKEKADEIYALDMQSPRGQGVTWFTDLFPKNYYEPDDSYTETCVSAVNGDPYRQVEVEFPSEAGTVYGGSLTIAEDGSGVLTVDGLVDTIVAQNGNLTSTYFNWPTNGAGSVLGDTVRASFNRNSQTSNMITTSDKYKWRLCDQVPHQFAYAVDTPHWYINNQLYLYLPSNLVGETKESWVSYIANNPIHVYIQFANPITYTLTAPEITTLLGENNLWHDANGDISVGYKANTKLYIDNKIAELVARIVNS